MSVGRSLEMGDVPISPRPTDLDFRLAGVETAGTQVRSWSPHSRKELIVFPSASIFVRIDTLCCLQIGCILPPYLGRGGIGELNVAA